LREQIVVVGFSMKSAHSVGYNAFTIPEDDEDYHTVDDVERFVGDLLRGNNPKNNRADVISIRRVVE
jgi:hypothetical protein